MRIIYMGTPEIAEEALSALLKDGEDIVAVYTRQDKPVGRKQEIIPSPVKQRAAVNRIPIHQPACLTDPNEIEQIRALEPDLIIVVAYGMILPPEVLEIPTYGCINMHVSLLPKYRGAAPIQWAIINGEEETGITVMQMDEGIDTGPVLAQRPVQIPPDATSGELFEIVSGIGARFLSDVVSDIKEEKVEATPQEGEESYAPRLDKSDGEMDFSYSADALHNLVRGCNPWPLAWFTHKSKRVQVLRTRKTEETGPPGQIARTNPLTVCCGDGALMLETLLPAGARSMTGAAWAAGRRFKAGDNILK